MSVVLLVIGILIYAMLSIGLDLGAALASVAMFSLAMIPMMAAIESDKQLIFRQKVTFCLGLIAVGAFSWISVVFICGPRNMRIIAVLALMGNGVASFTCAFLIAHLSKKEATID